VISLQNCNTEVGGFSWIDKSLLFPIIIYDCFISFLVCLQLGNFVIFLQTKPKNLLKIIDTHKEEADQELKISLLV